MTDFLRFQDLNALVQVDEPDVVWPKLGPVLAAWPFEKVGDDGVDRAPFATLSPQSGRRWRLAAPSAVNPIALHNPISAICDLIVEMSWERLRSRPDLLCLHAAAVQFGDQLVIFPNARRAGKSLLSATLAGLGHPVFTDDFIPLAVNPDTQVISGLANGIAPRLRLPLPDNISQRLRDWITDRMAIRNRQYGYLTDVNLPQSGTTAPVGAIVILERDPELTKPASLTPVTRDDAMASLLLQNFGRQVHAGAILRVMDAVTQSVPVIRLQYNDVEEAAALLHDSPMLQDLPAAHMQTSGVRALPSAKLDLPRVVHDAPVDLAQRFVRRAGFTAIETETKLYLADVDGVEIHRLNPVSMAIWHLLDQDLTGAEMVAVLQEVYPEVPAAQLQGDTARALAFLVAHRLAINAATSGDKGA